MGTYQVQSCKCGGKPVVTKSNKGKWRVMCPSCQRFYTRDKDSREEAISAWDNNIGSIGKKKKSNVVTALLFIALSFVFSGCASFNGSLSPASARSMQNDFQAVEYASSNGVSFKVRVYLPDMPLPRKFPLIVYLHGAGQNGVNNVSQLDENVGCLYSFIKGRDDYQAVIVAPQCPECVYWRDESMLDALKDMIEDLSGNPYIDETRIYIAGFSMGGDGAWKLGLKYPYLMTTIIPVCGGPLSSMEPDIPHVHLSMVGLNIWAFNNYDDPVVRPNYAKSIMSQLWIMSDTDNLNFTENISGGHSGKEAFSNRDLWIWTFSTHRIKPAQIDLSE